MKKKTMANTFLFMTAIIWGGAFVAQRTVMEFLGPFLYSGIRMYLGSISLIALIIITLKSEKAKLLFSPNNCENQTNITKKEERLLLVKAGIVCGFIMYFAGNFQQVGLIFTTATKTGFITTLYIVIVPIIGIFLKHQITKLTWISVIMATIGLYLLCITTEFSIEKGDFIVLIGAVFWALHIISMGYYAKRVHVLKLVSAQFFVAGSLSFLTAPFADAYFCENVQLINLLNAIPSILYVGILSSAGAAVFQGLGQKYASPTTSSLILSTEAVFGAIAGFIFLNELLDLREIIGCLLMFTAIIIVQINGKYNN